MKNLFKFNNYDVTLSEGTKNSNDYILKYNDKQFKDEEFFSKILNYFNTPELFLKFIQTIRNNAFLTFYKDKILSPCQGLSNIKIINSLYNNLKNNQDFDDVQKMLIFLSILRIDIDNICYPPEKNNYNGGIRHFVQLLLLGGCYFELEKYSTNLGFNINHVNVQNYPKFISEIGYPKNEYKITTSHFKSYYEIYFESEEF